MAQSRYNVQTLPLGWEGPLTPVSRGHGMQSRRPRHGFCRDRQAATAGKSAAVRRSSSRASPAWKPPPGRRSSSHSPGRDRPPSGQLPLSWQNRRGTGSWVTPSRSPRVADAGHFPSAGRVRGDGLVTTARVGGAARGQESGRERYVPAVSNQNPEPGHKCGLRRGVPGLLNTHSARFPLPSICCVTGSLVTRPPPRGALPTPLPAAPGPPPGRAPPQPRTGGPPARARPGSPGLRTASGPQNRRAGLPVPARRPHPKEPPPGRGSGDAHPGSPASREAREPLHQPRVRGRARGPLSPTARRVAPNGRGEGARGRGDARVGGTVPHLTPEQRHSPAQSAARWSRGRAAEGGARGLPRGPVSGAAAAGNAPGAGPRRGWPDPSPGLSRSPPRRSTCGKRRSLRRANPFLRISPPRATPGPAGPGRSRGSVRGSEGPPSP